ncbi:MAG: universal stress protein [Rhodothermaceae bacterium]|nr:universal stress protein [Rhodothermaceae bacterium]
MLHLRRILFPTDYSACAEHAFDHAAFLGAQFDAELHVLHVEAPVDAIEDEPTEPRPHSLSDEDAAFVRLIEVEKRGDSVREVILRYARAQDVDLIVMGTHGRRGVQHFLLGSVAERIVREAPCAVLTVGPTETTPATIQRILAPVDFSGRSYEAVKHARALADLYDAKVDLLHVVEATFAPDVYGLGLAWSDVIPDVIERTDEAMAEIARDLLGERAGITRVEVGADAAIIIEVARQKADLIVMGTHGRTGLERFALGSVTERVVQHAACPVFTVRSFGASLLVGASRENADADLT